MKEISDGVIIADIQPGLKVVFELTADVPKFDPIEANFNDPVKISRQTTKNKEPIKFAAWGKDNKLPHHIMKMVLNNNLAPGSLDTKDQITLGDQFIFYYYIFEKGKKIPVPFFDNELEEWLEMIRINNYAEESVIDFDWLANFWAQLSFGKKGGGYEDKIVRINPVEAIDCRCSIQNPKTKRVEYYGVGDWASRGKTDIQLYPAFDPDFDDIKELENTFMMHMKKKTIGNPYYALPTYIGAQYWLRHANKIPIWKTNNMDNSMNLKYHIEVPERYFMTLYPEPKYSRDDRKKEYEKMIDQISKMLSGAEHVGKAFSSQILIDPATQKELPGWKITQIANEINHEAYSKDYEDANSAILSAIGVDPSLSGVMTSGKMGAGSGSEKRLAYEFHAKVKTRYARHLLLRPVQTAMAINKYDRRKVDGEERKIYIGIQDVEFTTLDQNPTGSEKVMVS
jgi:hypothetical protein